jgi:hypothetical protein
MNVFSMSSCRAGGDAQGYTILFGDYPTRASSPGVSARPPYTRGAYGLSAAFLHVHLYSLGIAH